MLDEQTKRAVETMAQCGCELDTLHVMFPQIQGEEIDAIWHSIKNAKKDADDEDDIPNISCNCS